MPLQVAIATGRCVRLEVPRLLELIPVNSLCWSCSSRAAKEKQQDLIPTFVLLSHINEDKRKTEGQKQIFNVVYEVDGCPVSEFTLTLRGLNRCDYLIHTCDKDQPLR